MQRVIRTTPIVSGETDTSDAATRSRYTHLQISASQRLGNHVNWMRDNRQYFFLFWRHLMVHRPEFVQRVMKLAADWFTSPATDGIPERSRVTYSLAYAAFRATSDLFESHTPQEMDEFKAFIISRASAAADDVSSDVNVNVFIQDVITAYKAGAIPDECFRVEKERVAYPEAGRYSAPNQGPWDSYRLYMDPNQVISALQIYLRKGGQNISLRYKDLRDQLSKNDFWVRLEGGRKLCKRFGKRGSMDTTVAWGIHVDWHPLGLQHIDDETFRAALTPADQKRWNDATGLKFAEGDPRKGDLFAIIGGVEKKESEDQRDQPA